MKARVLITICALTLMAFPAFAQEANTPNGSESNIYYVNVRVEKIYICELGYVVTYRRGLSGTAKAYIPLNWFEASAGKAERVRLATRSAWPSMTVYYKDGTFSHVRLYVHPNEAHETWGYVAPSQDFSSDFEGVDGITIEY